MRQKFKKMMSVLSALAMTIAAMPAVQLPKSISASASSTVLHNDINSNSTKRDWTLAELINVTNLSDSKSDGSKSKWVDEIKLTTDTVVKGDLILDYDIVPVNGELETRYFNSLDLDGKSLTVYGNIIQARGTVKINNGSLNVYGNYAIEDAKTNSAGETSYESCYATLKMENQYDKVSIGGNFTTHNLYSYDNVYLCMGTLSIGGDIWSDGGFMAASINNAVHKTVLNGENTQKVYVSNDSKFDEFEVINPSQRTIAFGGDLRVNKFVSDINIKSNNLNISYFDLNKKNMTIDGDVIIQPNTSYYESYSDLNGGSLNINGNILQKSGTVKCNNGELSVTGNYTMENTTTNNKGETVYETCYATLEMKDKYDKVNIGGNFTTHIQGYGLVYLYNGTLSIGGDVWSDGSIITNDNYEHKTVLNGDKTQKVYIYDICNFDELEVINSLQRTIVFGGDLSVNKFVSDINIKVSANQT